MNVYVIHGIARDIPLSTIFRGICPFLAADLLHLALLVAFPALALALPALLGT
jgi:TRAP-type C4-dicarboxylate transport system permease large subunit